MARTRKSSPSSKRIYRGQHRFEHWYRDNQVYFITARCRNRYPAFAAEQAKHIFWQQLDRYTEQFSFVPWVTSLLDNHYHTLGYLRVGDNLGPLMQRLHGSVAKLVNDVLESDVARSGGPRLVPFWRETKGREYFDGCIRDEDQCRKAYRYILIQSQRHGVCNDWRSYRHTRIHVELERAVNRALKLGAFLEGVPYKRYQQREPGR